MSTITKPCTCKHEFQDREYGKGQRAHNLSADGKLSRCTVCGAGRPKKGAKA